MLRLLLVLSSPFWLPVWLPFWAMRRGWRWLVALTLAGFLGGCAMDSARRERSPCACLFLPFDVAMEVSRG